MATLCDEILKDFGWEMKKYKNITVLISVKHCDKYSVLMINCVSLDKKWLFHTITWFSEEDFIKFWCQWKGLQYCFECLME